MFIIILRNNWCGLGVVLDCYSQPKQFTCESEAIDYCEAKSNYPFQIIEVSI